MITTDYLEQIVHWVKNNKLDGSAIGKLRRLFPACNFFLCLEDEIGAFEPVHEDDWFNLYLVDSGEHCMKLTKELELASGVLIATLD